MQSAAAWVCDSGANQPAAALHLRTSAATPLQLHSHKQQLLLTCYGITLCPLPAALLESWGAARLRAAAAFDATGARFAARLAAHVVGGAAAALDASCGVVSECVLY